MFSEVVCNGLLSAKSPQKHIPGVLACRFILLLNKQLVPCFYQNERGFFLFQNVTPLVYFSILLYRRSAHTVRAAGNDIRYSADYKSFPDVIYCVSDKVRAEGTGVIFD